MGKYGNITEMMETKIKFPFYGKKNALQDNVGIWYMLAMHGAASKSSDKCFHYVYKTYTAAAVSHFWWISSSLPLWSILQIPFSASMPVHKSHNAIQALPFWIKMCYARHSDRIANRP